MLMETLKDLTWTKLILCNFFCLLSDNIIQEQEGTQQ